MTEKTLKGIPDYSHAKRSDVPGQFKWNVEDIYPRVQEWETDKTLLVQMMDQIQDLSKDWTATPARMFQTLNHLDEVEKKEANLYVYTSLLSDTDMGSSSFQAMKGEVHALSVKLADLETFVEPGILELGIQKVNLYLEAEPKLKVYEFMIRNILRMEKHILPADKESIVAQTGLFTGSTGKASGILNDLDMPAPAITLSDGSKVRLNTATYQRYRDAKEPKDRRKVMRTFWKNHTRFRNTHAVLLDGAIKSHFFNAQVHSFDTCLDAALYPRNIDTDVYHTLLQTVKENLSPLHRYLKLKAKMLNIDKMLYDDIYASAVPAQDKDYPYQEGCAILLDSLKPLGGAYTDVLAKGLKDGWVDLYANKGKRSGAYSQGSLYDIHPYILMNYNGKFDSLSTLTHEFGHALHSWFSNRAQPYPVAHYPIFLAEIASTFNENLLVQYIIKNETDDRLKLYILDQFIDGFRGTLYRQTLFADFELAMHQKVEKGHSLTPDWLDQLYLKLTRLFYGHKEKVVQVDKYIQNEWSGIPHFYYNFYVYQYSTGIVASTALAQMVLSGGESERRRYLDFLKSGGTRFPLDTLKEAGVDLTSPEPIKIALTKFDQIVSQMEEIVQRLGKEKKESKKSQ